MARWTGNNEEKRETDLGYMRNGHTVIIVPGLGDYPRLIASLIWFWNLFGVIPYVHVAPWNDKSEPFTPKLERLLTRIDSLGKDRRISLLGISAGGSLVGNAYMNRRSKISSVVLVSSRLRAGKNVFPSLPHVAKYNPAFEESVLLFEKSQKNLTKKDKKKIFTVRAWFDAEIPSSTSWLEGVKSSTIPSAGHAFPIMMALTVFSKQIIDFVKKNV